ncbi:hypothetical protein DL767_010763 [Monosporascus sp. MG133]|nr:hypothetical protein DL767_010763 [Monosporascus sp. MG133]
MRLVNVKTHRLEVFVDQNTPPYAILSHTWGSDSEELTLRDVKEGKINKPGVGLVKFQGCCDQASKDGFEYVWIDTCCIDKTDLVELSEAINSMFRWYKYAHVCYVYLSDVPDDQNPREVGSKFRASRWFQRGWTLQELLAPRCLIFYNSEWHPLGTKVQLSPVIESITGIPRLFLKGIVDLYSASVAQRMSWAAQRDTKRKEDIAYCLLGIFGIAMPMIYGEGGYQAFIRLQEQIMRSTRDHSILAWGLSKEQSTSYSESRARGVLAAAPSDFANSGHVIHRNRSYFDALEISSGSLRISLPLLITPAETIGLLNCGPEGDAQQVVGIPLVKVASGGSDEYIRPRGYHSVLRLTPAFNALREFIYIKNDNGASAQSSNQQHWVYDDDDFADVDLELLDVAPQSSWDQDRAVITSTTKSDPTLVRLRHKKEGSQDFILILEFREQDTCVEAHHLIMICSRDTSLEAIAGKLDHVIQNTSGMKSASNGLLDLQLTMEPIAERPMFTIRPEAMLRPPDVTFDATAGLQKSYLMLVIERVLHAQGRGEDLRNIDYCEKSYELKSIYGQPPLLWASENGDTEMIKLLLDNGIDMAASNNGKRTPLVAASDEGHVDVVRLLLATSKIDVNSKDSESGRTPLMAASDKGHVDVVRQLLAASKTDIDLKDSESGRTSLSWAAEKGYETVVKLLLGKGADVDVKDKATRTALSYAAERGHKAIVLLLCKSGAATNDETTAWRLCQTLESHKDSVWLVAFSHDSKLLVSASKDHTVRLWDTATGQLRHTLEGHNGGVWSAAFSHDSKLLASASWEAKSILLWDTTTGQLQKTLRGHTNDVWLVAFSHDSNLLASGSMDNTVRLWDTATGKLRQTLEGHKNGVWSVAFSRDSKLLASGSMDHTIRLWDSATGRLQRILWGHRKGVWSVTFSHNSKLLASASMDHTIRLWDTATGRLQQSLWGHSGDISSVVFSHNSKLLASGSMDNTFRLWDTATGRLLKHFWDHKDGVWSVAFSHDSKLLASASKDHTIRLWDTATGELQQALWGHRNGVRFVTFSYDSSLLASASIDHTVRLWESC